MASRIAARNTLRTPATAPATSVGQRRAASAGYGRYGNHFISEHPALAVC
jgi:hypothetical protein